MQQGARLKVVCMLGFSEANKVVCLAFVCISQISCNQCFTQKSFGCCFGWAWLIHVHICSSCSSQAQKPWIFTSSSDPTDLLRPISCAYEFGVPQASGQIHQGDGPYKGDVWDAESNLLAPNLALTGWFLGSTPTGASHHWLHPWLQLTSTYNLFCFGDVLVIVWTFQSSTKTWLWTGEEIPSDHAGCVHKARDTQRYCLEKREGHVDELSWRNSTSV